MSTEDYHYTYDGTIVKVEGVNLAFPKEDGTKHVVLRDVNAQIDNIHRDGLQQGQVVGLLGPSGIGKTQLFRVMAGLAIPGGELTGRVVLGNNEIPVSPALVGVVAQKYPLFEHRTVQGNLLVATEQLKLSKADRATKVAELLDMFGLKDHGGAYPAQLSGGQRQRVAIAQQIMCGKQFMLMDEPFSGLDPLMISRTLQLIQKVNTTDEYNTVIIVTHDISSAIAASDTLWIMGREYDAGQQIPGAKIVKTYNLADMGLAWRPDIRKNPLFTELRNEIGDLFPRL